MDFLANAFLNEKAMTFKSHGFCIKNQTLSATKSPISEQRTF